MTKFESHPLPGDVDFNEVAHGPGRSAPPGPERRPWGHYGWRDRNGNGGAAPGTEPRFHALNEHEFDVVAVVDASGRFLFVSASAERLFGYDTSGAIGQDAFGLFDSLSIEPVRALFADLVARRRLSISLEMQTVRADGTTIDLDVVAINHLSDPIHGIVVNIRDITSRKQLEQRVRDEDRRQATIIDSLADGVLMVDAAGTVARVNEAFEVMFEAPRIRVVGQPLELLLARARPRGSS